MVLNVTPNSNFVFSDWYLWGWADFPRNVVMNTHDFWSCLKMSVQADTECFLFLMEKRERRGHKLSQLPACIRVRENTASDPTGSVMWSSTGRFLTVKNARFFIYNTVLIRLYTYSVERIITISESKQVRLLMSLISECPIWSSNQECMHNLNISAASW